VSKLGGHTVGPDGTPRFRIGYRKPETLLHEFTRSVNRNCVTLNVPRPVKAGTRFVFELMTVGVRKPVEVEGEVLSVQAGIDGRFRLNITYSPGQRGGLDDVVFRVFDAQRAERVRRSPRVPMNLRAAEDAPYSPGYLIRDLSLGGAGMEVEASDLPKTINRGSPALIQITLKSGGLLDLRGVVVWARRAGPNTLNWDFGIQFVEDLELESLEMLDEVVTLRSIPRRARISFGLDAFLHKKME